MENQVEENLQEHILSRSSLLFKALNKAFELDCILALAETAKLNNLVRPTLTGLNFLLHYRPTILHFILSTTVLKFSYIQIIFHICFHR